MTTRQKKALTALLTHSTHKEAAQAAGISARQLRAYLQDPDFKKEYRERLDMILDEATAAAKQAMTPAVCALVEIASDTGKSDTARIMAARAVLDAGLRMHDAVDVTARIQQLERDATQYMNEQ